MKTDPRAVYEALIADEAIEPDPAQAAAVDRLHVLHDALIGYEPNGRRGLFGFLRKDPPPAPKGLYLWGDVGRGKSMLMDMFFDTAPVAAKKRVHFHEFMLSTHEAIHDWRQRHKAGEIKGEDDPIPPVAKSIAADAWLLCFDEFQVSDITDAMILGRLFTALFEEGVVVVATSNRHPDMLYEGGLNRQLFLPFIDLLKEKLDVMTLDGKRDYRLDRLKGKPVYHSPLGERAAKALDEAWAQLTDEASYHGTELEVQGRVLPIMRCARGVARFTFDELCARPLGAADYLRIAHTFHTVILEDIPQLTPAKRNEAKRFVTLIDALYEQHTRLICSAAADAADLYPEGDGSFEFARTVSRLTEMQSSDYFDRHEQENGAAPR